MKNQTLQVSDTLDDQAARDLSARLLRIPGVDLAVCTAGTNSISINFDEDRTSALEIETVISRAGHRLAIASAKSGGGSCCGGCGGR